MSQKTLLAKIAIPIVKTHKNNTPIRSFNLAQKVLSVNEWGSTCGIFNFLNGR